MSISSRDKFLEENPDVKQLIVTSPLLVDPTKLTAIGHKPNGDFRNMLTSMKKFYKGSNINDF